MHPEVVFQFEITQRATERRREPRIYHYRDDTLPVSG